MAVYFGNKKVQIHSGSIAGVSLTDFVQGTMQGEYIDANVTSLRFGAFASCANITKVSLPNCTKIPGSYAFSAAGDLEEISLPNVTSGTFTSTFRGCYNVKTIDLRSLGGVTLDTNCFRGCLSLKTLILGGTAVNPIINTNVLYGTPETMSIYVPDNLVDDYKAATNWATFASRIKSRNDYPGGAI